LSLGFSGVLLWRESRQQQTVSGAVWIPCIWLLILGSRPISVWLNLSGPGGVDAMMEGSPVDRTIYLVLMLSALVVVFSRRLHWGEIFRRNPLLVAFFAYCAVSVAWSDFPAIAFRRWFKSLGDPLMALILLSELSPAAAVGTVLKRCAYVLVPLSIVFVKYFPQLGRVYDDWTGAAVYTGVTTNKNMLGYLLLVFGLFFWCTVLTRSGWADKKVRRTELAVSVLLLGMIGYLLRITDSQTSLIALCAASAVAMALGSPVVRKYFGAVALGSLVIGLGLQLLFDIGGMVIASAGRDTTLTGRTEVWAAVIAMAQHPLVGAGFQSFWLGDRLQAMWAKFPVFRPNQAHNGYIEIYLNLGWIGLLILVGVLITFYGTMRRKLEEAVAATSTSAADLILAKFGIGYLAAYLLYNISEAIFQPLNFLFIVFLVLGIRYQLREAQETVSVTAGLRPAWALPEPSARDEAAAIANGRRWRPPANSGGIRPRGWTPPGSSDSARSEPEGIAQDLKNPSAKRGWPTRRSGTSWAPPNRRSDKYSR
jgi:exopolysaccharide production protein ExoQ